MSTNDPMTQEQLDAIRTRADSVTTLRRAMPGDWQRLALHLSEDAGTLIAEVERISQRNEDLEYVTAQARKTVERLRALTTVDDAMVERAARVYYGYQNPGELAAHPMSWERLTTTCPNIADIYRYRVGTIINAALNPGEDS